MEGGRATVMTARWGTYGDSPALLGDSADVLGGRLQRCPLAEQFLCLLR